jgi:hypothetical protein
MCDAWMPHIPLPLTIEQFRQLPRNAAVRRLSDYKRGRPSFFLVRHAWHAAFSIRRVIDQ